MEDSLPAFAQRVTVFGSTLKSAATSAGVKSVSSFWPFIHASTRYCPTEAYPVQLGKTGQSSRFDNDDLMSAFPKITQKGHFAPFRGYRHISPL